ncbi:MAG TPA: hypothetical protein VHX38_33385 [Pseudonocardiaceae bacterium]|jgi:hypothetical protein|nr:hypothetical protein [Pseudonocardiaceae bacterium]
MSSDDVTTNGSRESAGVSRRRLLRGAAGLGAAGLAAGLMVNSAVAPAAAATAPATADPTEKPATPGAVGEPMVAHVRDASTGEVDLFVGTRHVRFTDPQLAARLARAAG